MITQYERDLNAAVEFLAEDEWHFTKAMHFHRPHDNGWCRACTCRVWPCLTFELAVEAKARYVARRYHIPIQRKARP